MEYVCPEIDNDCGNVRILHDLRCCPAGLSVGPESGRGPRTRKIHVAAHIRSEARRLGAISASCGRSAIEIAIGHMKTEGHLGRGHFKGGPGTAANVRLSAVGHNFRPILAWLIELLGPVPVTATILNRLTKLAQSGFITDDF